MFETVRMIVFDSINLPNVKHRLEEVQREEKRSGSCDRCKIGMGISTMSVICGYIAMKGSIMCWA